MSWRKWLVRVVVFSAMGGLATGGFVYERWTNPAAVRIQVLDKLTSHFPGARIILDSAHMRLLGDIALNELRLSRRDDPRSGDFAYIPSVTIYHDKEQLAEGRLAIRKMVLDRPKIHVVRRPDGRWNLAGILGIPHPEIAIPTVVVQRGTIVFEDRGALHRRDAGATGPDGLTGFTIKDVSFELMNDPLTTVQFKGVGVSDLAQGIQVTGSWNRRTGDVALGVAASHIPVDGSLVERIKSYFPDAYEHAQQLSGLGSLHAEFNYRPGVASPWTHDVRWRLSDGRLQHPQLPATLDHLDATVRCLDGQVTLEKLTANAGAAEVRITGTAQGLRPDADLKASIEIKRLQVDSQFFAAMPANLQKLNADYAPRGTANVTMAVSRKEGQWTRMCIVHPEDVTASFIKFPYPLEHIKGKLDLEVDPRQGIDKLKVDLNGSAGGARVFIKGTVNGAGPTSGVEMKVWGNDIVMDEKLRAALSYEHQKLASAFEPTGQANFEAFIHRALGSHEFSNHYVIRFHDATARYKEFPYPLENVSGVLDIQPDRKYWEFRDFQATHHGVQVRTSGHCRNDHLSVAISGTNLPLDGDLEAALSPALKKAWTTFAPAGSMDFVAHVERLPANAPDIAVTVTPKECSIKPKFFPFALDRLTGTIHYENHQVTAERIRAVHGATVLTLDRAEAVLEPNGNVWTKLTNVRGNPIVADDDLLGAMPPFLRTICQELQLKDPVALTTGLTIKTFCDERIPPIIYWDGEIGLQQAAINAGVRMERVTGKAACRGTYNGQKLEGLDGNILLDEATLFGQPFQSIHTRLLVSRDKPEMLQLRDLVANIYGGKLGGEARIDFGPKAAQAAQLNYELNLNASQIKLEEFGRVNLGTKAPLSGLLAAKVNLSGEGSQLAGLRGRGSIDVPQGKLYNLPPLLDLLNFLHLRLPDGTAFEEARATFTIAGSRVIVNRIDLYGNSISLQGNGEMNLNGTDLNLDFYAIWGRIVQWLPPVINKIPPAISSKLLKIKMRGQIGNVECTKEPVPVLVEPVKELLERLRGRGVVGSEW